MFKIDRMQLNGSNIIQLPKKFDRRGNLSVIEEIKNIPFKIKRTYWIYDVPGGEVEEVMPTGKIKNSSWLYQAVSM